MADYIKRLFFKQLNTGSWISLYVVVKDSHPVEFFVNHQRARIASFKKKDAAKAFIGRIVCEGFEAVCGPSEEESIRADADAIEKNPTEIIRELKFHTLLELKSRTLVGGNKVNFNRLRKFADGKLHRDEEEFSLWLENALQKIKLQTRSQRTFKGHLESFRKAFRHLQTMPIAFKKYLHLVPIVEGRVKVMRYSEEKQKAKQVNRPCMSRFEIESEFNKIQSLEQACLLVAYLSMGFRAGEGERALFDYIDHDRRIHMNRIVTKTEINKTPIAPLATLVALKLGTAALPERRIPKQKRMKCVIERSRFRPSCATFLSLAGLSPILIAERLNHTDTTMIIRHYAKMSPPDMGGQTLQQYLNTDQLSIDGIPVEENLWDKYCLKLLLEQARRFGKVQEAKSVTKEFLRPSIIAVAPVNF